MAQFLAGPAPGTVDPFSLGQLATQTQKGMTAMGNRYDQLGVKAPGGSPQTTAASGGNMPSAGTSTPEAMDLGAAPSMTGGIPGMAGATLGQMQTNAMTSPTGSGGKTGADIFGNIFG